MLGRVLYKHVVNEDVRAMKDAQENVNTLKNDTTTAIKILERLANAA